MNDYHSDSKYKNNLFDNVIEKDLLNDKEYLEQLDKIIILKGKLVVYLSIIYGAAVATGLIYLSVF